MSSMTYTSPTERVQTWLDGTTLHIRFNNPARHNALSVDMWEAVPPLLAGSRGDDRVRLVVFSGAGEKSFVSGADISQFEDMRAAREAVAHYEEMAEAGADGHPRFRQADAGLHPRLLHRRRRECGDQLRHPHRLHRLGVRDSRRRLGLGYRYSAMKNLVDLVGPGAAKDLFFTARAHRRRRKPSRWAWSRASARRTRWPRCWPNTPPRWPTMRR